MKKPKKRRICKNCGGKGRISQRITNDIIFDFLMCPICGGLGYRIPDKHKKARLITQEAHQ